MLLFSLKSYKNLCIFYIYNIEIKELVTFEISEKYNELESLLKYLKANNKKYIIGYNMEKYNNYILNFILENYARLLKETAKSVCIQLNTAHLLEDYKYVKYYRFIDLMKYISKSNERISFIDVKIYFNKYILEKYIDNDVFIDINDRVLIHEYMLNNIDTMEMLYQHCLPKIIYRSNLNKGLRVDLMNKYDSMIGNNLILNSIMTKYNVDRRAVLDLRNHNDFNLIKGSEIINRFHFKTQELQRVYQSLLNLEIGTDTKFLGDFKLGRDKYKVNSYLSKSYSGKLVEGDLYCINFKYLYIDVLLKNKANPSFLDNEFCSVIQDYYNSLLIAIKTGNQELIKHYNLLLLNIVDNLNVSTSFTLSNKTYLNILINSALILFKLIEELTLSDIEIIFADKENIVVKLDNNEEIFNRILKDWSDEFLDNMSLCKYKKLVYIDQNNYLLIYDYGKESIKNNLYKGVFDSKRTFTNINELSISKGLCFYFLNLGSVKEVFLNNDNINDFMISYKTNAAFNVSFNGEIIQRHVLYYYNKDGSKLIRIGDKNKAEVDRNKVSIINKKINLKTINKVVYYNKFLTIQEQIIPKQLNLFN